MADRNVFVILIALSLVCVHNVHAWSGNVCSSVGCRYETQRVCAYQTWAACCSWKYITVAQYYTNYFCCSGWTHNGNENCVIPVCNPPCSNGGTCQSPGVCRCPVQFSGPRCDNSVCSHESPCYPGTCVPPNNCNCDTGFTNPSSSTQDRCLKIQDVKSADLQIYQMQVRMSYWPRNMTPPMEKYGILADSTNLKGAIDFFWTNRKNFNRLQTTCSSQFFLDVTYPPPYVSKATFGIVSASVVAVLTKLPAAPGTNRYIALNETLPCDRNVSSIAPEVNLFMCNITNTNFDRLIEHGDILQVYYKTAGGGFRRLVNLNYNPPSLYLDQPYQGLEANLSVEFRFDFNAPTHCGEISSCQNGEVMLSVSDGTMTNLLKISWSGWQDNDSKMFRYSMEVFKMTKTSDGKLEIRNDKALEPLINKEVMHAQLAPQEYPLPSPGMYSVILEVADLANNTKYVRRLCLFDPNPQITVDPTQKFFVSAANPAVNYSYLNNGSLPIAVTWLNYFRNAFHEDNALLGEVLPYPAQLEDGLKNIPSNSLLEDHEGNRTVDGIANARGIINFKVQYAKDHEGGRNQPTDPSSWVDVGLNTTFTVPDRLSEADTLTVWVKATDYFHTQLVQRIRVTLDSTPPVIQPSTGFRMNEIVPGVPFSSKFYMIVNDDESGILYTLWTFRLRNGTTIYQDRVEGRQVSSQECKDISPCRCNPDGVCFPYDQSFVLSNCHMMVRKENLKTEKIFVTADVTNRAGLVTRWTWEKEDLTALNGTNEYYPPQNVKVSQVSTDSVTITWNFPPSCFERTDVWVSVHLDGQETKVPVHKDATSYTLGGLKADTRYTIFMVTRYEGEQSSDSEAVVFSTASDGLPGGAIAGIVIGLLILAALVIFIILFVLWRKGLVMKKGPANTGMQRVSTAFNNIRRATQRGPFSNNAYRADSDEIYLYGSMTFDTHQTLPGDALTLMDHLMDGKFANIYKATLRSGSAGKQTVVSKMLKPGFSQDDSLKMMAKINFFATKVGSHDNVIHFLGAVTDNTSWGPAMILEYCEGGQLDKWLTAHAARANEQVIEQLYQFSAGISKGMEYLASKQIVHKRLAARNILLTFLHEVRVAGFGPQNKESDQDGDKQQTRIPAKWSAPEVLAEKIPTEKSDVWSFGVVLWEIFSMGQSPYREIRSQEIGARLKHGYRMEKPELSDDSHYELMKECWEYKPSFRPTFLTIRSRLCQNFTPNRSSTDFYYDSNELR